MSVPIDYQIFLPHDAFLFPEGEVTEETPQLGTRATESDGTGTGTVTDIGTTTTGIGITGINHMNRGITKQ